MNVGGESCEPVENVFFGDAEKGIEAQVYVYICTCRYVDISKRRFMCIYTYVDM
jgi:hypothetical protein